MTTRLLRPFNSLTPAEQGQVLQFADRVPGLSRTIEQAVTDPALEYGRQLLTLWGSAEPGGGELVLGTMGVITRAIRYRSEVFLTCVHAGADRAGRADRAGQVLPALLEEAYRLARAADGASGETAVRLGIRPGAEHLQPAVERLGFHHPYRFLTLSRALSAQEDLGSGLSSLRFEPVTHGNMGDYIQIQNEAFQRSPHGAPTDEGEVSEELKTAASPEMHQIGYVGGVPVVALKLGVDGRTGDVDILAVAPGMQGQGLGRRGLERALHTLRAHGVEEVRLLVAETNEKALILYRRAGFGRDATFSTWFVGPPLSAVPAAGFFSRAD